MASCCRWLLRSLHSSANLRIATGAVMGLSATSDQRGNSSLSCTNTSGHSSTEQHRRSLQSMFGYSCLEDNPSLPMTTDVKLGSYKDIVQDLRSKLKPYVIEGKRFEIAVFGHGGRDTTCCLALVDAVAGDELLKKTVKIHHYSCSWVHDEWEDGIARYYELLASTGKIQADAVNFVVMKYHEDISVTVHRLRKHIACMDCIVQCEQGVDMFVEPITSEWLQDNYEDFVVHSLCLAYAAEARIPALLVQTNADLDVGRGIDGDDVSTTVFDGNLQMHGAFNIGVTWKSGKVPDAEAFSVIGAHAKKSDISSVIDLALNTTWAPNKKNAILAGFGFDVEDFASLQTESFYASYIAFAATLNTSISVAGVLELFNVLKCRGHDLPFVPLEVPPHPQWVAAEFLQPSQTKHGLVRVVSQFRRAGLDSAPDFASFWSRWMFHRGLYGRVRGVVVDSGRYNDDFCKQLEKAKAIAEDVRRECQDFELWHDGSPLFLERALRRMATSVDKHRYECQHFDISFEDQEKTAKMLQTDFGKLSPLAAWTSVNKKMVLDFTCRLLESCLGIENEYRQIASGLQPLAKKQAQKLDRYEGLFKEALINTWRYDQAERAQIGQALKIQTV